MNNPAIFEIFSQDAPNRASEHLFTNALLDVATGGALSLQDVIAHFNLTANQQASLQELIGLWQGIPDPWQRLQFVIGFEGVASFIKNDDKMPTAYSTFSVAGNRMTALAS